MQFQHLSLLSLWKTQQEQPSSAPLLLVLFQLVRIRDRSSPVFQQSSRPEPPAPLVLLHPPELTLTPRNLSGSSVTFISRANHTQLPASSKPPSASSFCTENLRNSSPNSEYAPCSFWLENIFKSFLAQREHTWWEKPWQTWTTKRAQWSPYKG